MGRLQVAKILEMASRTAKRGESLNSRELVKHMWIR